MVGIQGSWEKEGAEIRCKVEECARIGNRQEGQNPNSREAGESGFLVKVSLSGIIEVIDGTKCDESIWMRVPGERGTKDFFTKNIYMPQESKSTIGWTIYSGDMERWQQM